MREGKGVSHIFSQQTTKKGKNEVLHLNLSQRKNLVSEQNMLDTETTSKGRKQEEGEEEEAQILIVLSSVSAETVSTNHY